MIDFTLNGVGEYDIPELILCNPDRTQLYSMGQVQGLKYHPRLHGLSEINFDIYNSYLNKLTETQNKVEYYDLIQKNRLIAMSTDFSVTNPKIEWYIIYKVEEDSSNGIIFKKNILAYSYERTLGKKNADFIDGTYQFYSTANTSNTMMGKIISVAPSWKIGTVDTSLWNRYRTFEDIDKSLYDFMLEDCEEAYDCLFVFDTNTKTISAYDRTTYIKTTDVILSFSNLVKSVTIADDSEEIITALSVIGGGEVDIHSVNPTGDNYIYVFDYYKNTNWISQSLITAITNWETKIKNNRTNFSNYLASLKIKKSELLVLQNNLTTLEGELKAIDAVRSAQLPNVTKATTDQYNAKLTAINNKKKEIITKNSEITTINNSLQSIVNNCKLSANFTSTQIMQLDEILYQGEYINPNYITTDIMTESQKQDVYEQLYARGQQEALIQSVPQYSFNMDSMNFLFIEKFKSFTNELQLGKMINVEINESSDLWSYPILLELEIDYNDPTSFTMNFGTRINMSSKIKDISKILGDATSVNTKVSINSSLWDSPVKSGFMDEVTNYMDSNLNAANQEIINSVDQSVTIGNYGLRSRKLLSNGSYDPHQLWINNSLICMTDDNWQTSKLAIGLMNNGYYGVNAEVISGNLIAGNNLIISNTGPNGVSTFKVDGNGATLTNASLTIENSNARILINPSVGFRIQKKSNNSYINSFYADTNGDLNLLGSIRTLTNSNGRYYTLNSNGLTFYSNNSNVGSLFVENPLDGNRSVISTDWIFIRNNSQDGNYLGRFYNSGGSTFLQSNSITAGSTVGSGSRIQINSNSLNIYNDSSTNIGSLYRSTDGRSVLSVNYIGVDYISVGNNIGKISYESSANEAIFTANRYVITSVTTRYSYQLSSDSYGNLYWGNRRVVTTE